MPIYLYGLILSRNAAKVPADSGRPMSVALRAVGCDDLTGIVASVDAPPSREDRQAVMTHDKVLSRVARAGLTVLASRFGQTFADEDALCAELAAAPNRARLAAVLDRFEGHGEMRIVMRDGTASAAPARGSTDTEESPGRAYLEALRDKVHPRPPVDFHAILGALIREERVERRGDTYSISHLVRFEDEPAYRAELYTHPALQGAAVTGPHALYAFAEPGNG
jgi:hypothetical protein